MARRQGNDKATSFGDGKPLARSAELVVEELDSGLLDYDLRTDRAHSLSAPAARVWRCCDGETTADLLGATAGLDPEVAARALEELRACDLLDGASRVGGGTTRREATLKVAKIGGAAMASPLIASLAVPATAAAATSVTVEFCQNGAARCPSTDCTAGGTRNCCCCCSFGSNGARPAGCPSGNQKCCIPATQCTGVFSGTCDANPPTCP